MAAGLESSSSETGNRLGRETEYWPVGRRFDTVLSQTAHQGSTDLVPLEQLRWPTAILVVDQLIHEE